MLTAERIAARRQEIEASADLSGLLQRLAARAGPLLEKPPPVPARKATLSADGGVCPEDGSRLEFNPWSPSEHRCPRCGRRFRGERHDAAWAHYQHLWLAERAALLATLAVLGDRPDASQCANQLLQAYRNYSEFPNQDNVLGPSRLFFSTYLESIWLNNYLAAATLLRDAGQLSPESDTVVAAVADESAGLIGEFDEGLSNRQTWHNAALTAVAVWFEDEELATRAIQGSSGLLVHLLQGFGPDGMWYEGDNYHLFALRGQLVAMSWAAQAGVDLLADHRLALKLAAALRAPTLTALPDFTFPARKDSRFGVSLAQPMYLELWEVGLAGLNGKAERPADLWDWLRRLYQSPAPEAQAFDSYLYEAGEPPPERPRSRTDLSWWALLEMLPSLPASVPVWSPGSVFLEGQGLAILRSHDRYVSLECGAYGGGHGHPDRLNLVLHADGEYWLPDFGTGSYVSADLFWYRSTLAHNAPRLDGISQPPGDAVCDNFDQTGDWGWARGRYGDLARNVISAPGYVLDLLELTAAEDHLLELPLHLSGAVEIESPGTWEPAELREEFAHDPEQFVPGGPGPLVLHSCGHAGARLRLHFPGSALLLRARGPGVPGAGSEMPFYLLRARGRHVRFITVLEPNRSEPGVKTVGVEENAILVETSGGVHRHLATAEGWEVRTPNTGIKLRGVRRPPQSFEPLVRTDRPIIVSGVALHVAEPPPLDGTLDGFNLDEPLELDHEDQYRRSEEPYSGPDDFSARAYLNWSDDALYLAVEVTKSEVFARDPNTPPLRLDNEPDEIHADGIEVFLRLPPDEAVSGLLIVPSSAGLNDLIVRPVSGTNGHADQVRGSWSRTQTGYLITAAITPPGWASVLRGDRIGFDLLVNQMLPGRQRRAGQLVWSGGGGWIWLRGDRQDPARFGTVELR